ncbi:Choline/ethanolamine kinase [Caenorhabditis elegans]|uniref:Choline/ethanolamine kinase n=1 Tax=Caenorhabditis elegans TaxID=6239 RepID=Q9GZF3_CAEEL|nr:Choline/ethanolamine kinase [Caenorhabditis elegans]CCD67444.1 Choline/ethanolamine kinase [Caenorhabditis elegans]|eukprot:NP_503573.1 Choline Kinase B [Caenorhabditis elegans]
MISAIGTLFAENSLESDVILEKVIELGSDYLRGGWALVEKSEVTVTQITGGQSNILYLATSASTKLSPDTPSCFLIRIHRQAPSQVFTETVVFSVLSERGLGPKLYGFFPGGRLEEFLPSRTLDVDSIKLPEIARQVGSLYPKYHDIEVPISKSAGALKFIKENLEGYKALGGKVLKMCPHSVKYDSMPSELTVEQIEQEIATFERWCKVFDETIVFSHNDLAPLNVLELNDTKEIVFIDFEYSSYNWRGFDLCMFLCENAFDYRDPTPPGLVIDQDYMENHPNLQIFCEAYIDTQYKMKTANPKQKFPLTEGRAAEVESLMLECKFFIPLVNMFWAVWSLRQHLAKYEIGMDLDVIASDRFSMYFHLKEQSRAIYEQFKK